MKWVLGVLVVFAVGGCSRGVAPAAKAGSERATQLSNGLDVVVRPIEGAKDIALVVLYDVGEHNDPEGASGMAHLLEHLMATAATPDRPARDIDALIDAYPEGWNAQTGNDYTVLATVFEPGRLEEEVKDAAARMGALQIEPEDVEREVGRLETELTNMYRAVPSLAAQNLAAQAVSPALTGARHGGVPEQIRTISIEALRGRYGTLYKPSNATLVLAGALDPERCEALVAKAFGHLPSGEQPPAMKGVKAPLGTGTTEVPAPAMMGGAYAAVAYAAPAPSDPEYPGFLMLAALLQSRGIDFGAPRGAPPVQFAPLDRPDVLIVAAPPLSGEPEAEAVSRLEAIVQREVNAATVDVRLLTRTYGFLLGLASSDSDAALNPYGEAFGIARRKQMGIEPARLAESINGLTEEELARARDAMLRHVGKAIVKPPGGRS